MQIIGKRIIRLPETDSTNLYAERLLQTSDADEGTVVTTGFQTAGKGQGDNQWESERGKNLLVTVILKPVFIPAGAQFILNKAVTLALCDLLVALGIEPSVKWPNDIYTGGKKIAGILISHRVSGSKLEHTIVGIGLNLNQEHFPPELANAVSVKTLTRVSQDPERMLDQLNRRLDYRYDLLRLGKSSRIEKDYLRLLQGLGRWLNYLDADGTVEGKILGVDEFGRLIMKLRNGTKKIFSHGEITIPHAEF